MKYNSTFLKVALFATGLAGIVAEYTLSTLATYFLGDSVFQWTMIVSIMLFSMGLGSRISKSFKDHLLEKFIFIEFSLSVVASCVTILVYTTFAFYQSTVFIIYGLSITLGLMIGMEIPLVIRLNEQFQSLRFNVSSALENDYYGSLVGGIFFAFVGLPYLGLTHTPVILGSVNFLVAILFIWMIRGELASTIKQRLVIGAVLAGTIILAAALFSSQIVTWGDSIRFKDEVVFSEQSRYQKIVLTTDQENYWLFINGHQQLSTTDEERYHEPLVHPAMNLHPGPREILILGGGDGAAVREVLKYSDAHVTLVDLDPRMTELARDHPVFRSINQDAFHANNLTVINSDGFTFLDEVNRKYDVIIADFPDPRTIDLGRLYSLEFYFLCHRALNANGVLVTQATSPYYARKAFDCIQKTIESAGFNTTGLHTQVPTLGEWGWVIAQKSSEQGFDKSISELNIKVPTRFLKNIDIASLFSFGENVFLEKEQKEVSVNRIHDPVLYKYYLEGRWDLY